MRRIQKNKAWFIGVVTSSAIALAIGLYNTLSNNKEDNENQSKTNQSNSTPPNFSKRSSSSITQYTNKSIALTLSHSILSSPLPLNEILLNSENVTFILPPNLSLEDLQYNLDRDSSEEESAKGAVTPKILLNNYKLLNCSNLKGYFNTIKNLKPDMLLVCSDDLGISKYVPSDLDKFVKEIVTLSSDRDEIYRKVLPIFTR